MEPFTLDRNFHKVDIIDSFTSCIWTERYYGDSAIELVVPPTLEMIKKLPEGVFVGLDGSDEIMIIETVNIEDGKLKASGISLLPWLNNRFVRTSNLHEDRYWYMSGIPAGAVLWYIVYYMCVEGSQYLNGTIDIGIPNPEQFVVPGLGLHAYDTQGENINVGVPFGPVYNALREIATTYEVGMQITLDEVTEDSYFLGFRSYRGLDRTSAQDVNRPVRFSPQFESFTDIKELRSIAALKTQAYAFAPSNPDGLATIPGVSTLTGADYTGFDLRAMLVFADDVTTDMVAGSSDNLVKLLDSRADDAIANNNFVQAIDGEIVPDAQLKYGVHYHMGDVIEVQGNSGIVQTARVTEYIRTQDAAGEKAYPTVAMIG